MISFKCSNAWRYGKAKKDIFAPVFLQCLGILSKTYVMQQADRPSRSHTTGLVSVGWRPTRQAAREESTTLFYSATGPITDHALPLVARA
jgi:hypothetical protein